MNNNSNDRPSTAWILIWLQILLSLGAIGGGLVFLIAPDGHLMHMPLTMLKNTPFSNFLIPGAILFTFLGIYPMAVAYSLWHQPSWIWPNTINPFKQYHWSWSSSLAAGIILIIWITVQVQMIEKHFLHLIYFIWGIFLIFFSLLPNVRKYYKIH